MIQQRIFCTFLLLSQGNKAVLNWLRLFDKASFCVTLTSIHLPRMQMQMQMQMHLLLLRRIKPSQKGKAGYLFSLYNYINLF